MKKEYEIQTQMIHQGNFSSFDKELCACKGSGWILTSFDTWEECPIHKGEIHPEVEEESLEVEASSPPLFEEPFEEIPF